jgi:CDP-paratose 2-epimerase
VGDHICYISDLRKMREHYPQWQITTPLGPLIEEMVARLIDPETARRTIENVA